MSEESAVGFSNPAADFSDIRPEPENVAAGTQEDIVYRGPEYSIPRKILGRITEFFDMKVMRSWSFFVALQLWTFTEFLLIWVTIITVLRSTHINPAPGFALLFFGAIKTIIFVLENLFAAANEGEAIHKHSLAITIMQQLVWDPLMEIPFTAVLLAGYHFDWCYFSYTVMAKLMVRIRLIFGIPSVLVMGLKWLIQIRECWKSGDFFERSKKVTLLSMLALVSAIWLLAFRIWYVKVSYMEPLCYFARMVKVVPKTEAQYQILLDLEDEALHYDNQPIPIILFCHQPRGINQEVIIQVLKHNWNEFEAKLSAAGLDYEILDIDVETEIIEERVLADGRRRFQANMKPAEFDFTKYHPLDEIIYFLRAIEREYPLITKLVSMEEKTFEGNSLFVLQISPCLDPEISRVGREMMNDHNNASINNTNSTTGPEMKKVDWAEKCAGKRQGLWIDFGIHAREWITPATAVWMIHQLVSTFNAEDPNGALVNVDWFIMPLVNPDGYQYSWDKDRFWRKNRRPLDLNGSRECMGTDLNRNFDIHWAEPGCSRNPCRDNYCGSGAFSEPETRGIRDFLLERNTSMLAYVNVHSYSQYWMYPYGFSSSVTPSDTQELVRVARLAIKSIEAINGTKYKTGTAPDLLYVVSGDASDWAKMKGGVKYSYSVELRPRFCIWNQIGFLLPQDQILPTAKETFAGFLTVAREIRL